jgi:hypothetical protein
MSPGDYSRTCIYIDVAPNQLVLCFTNVETTTAKHPSTRTKSGRITNTLTKCKHYHTNAQELFHDASREVNDVKTQSSSAKQARLSPEPCAEG